VGIRPDAAARSLSSKTAPAERLDHAVVGAELAAAGPDQDDRQRRAGQAGLGEQRQPVAARQDQVEQQEVDRRAQRQRQHLVVAAGGQRLVAAVAEGVDDPLADGRASSTTSTRRRAMRQGTMRSWSRRPRRSCWQSSAR
jgi:hypothetical protein